MPHTNATQHPAPPSSRLRLLCAACCAALAGLLPGCVLSPQELPQTQATAPVVAAPKAPIQTSSQTPAARSTPETAAAPEATAAPELNNKAFDSETLYSLLAAEFAGSRSQYQLALSNYAQQARQTRDPQIAERATLLARHLGDTDTALEIAAIWREAAPDNREALSNQAQAQLEAGQLQQAFSSSVQLLAEGEEPQFQLIAAHAGQLPDNERDALMARFEKQLKQHPRNEQLLLGKALLLEQQQAYPQALTLVRHTLKLHPQSLIGAIMEANLMHLLGHSEQALAKLQALKQQHPNNLRLQLQYARLLSQVNLPAAQQAFAELSEAMPLSGDIWLSYGLLALQNRDAIAARQAFTQLEHLQQHSHTTHYYLGLLDEADNQFASAIDHYQQVTAGDELYPALARLLLLQLQQGQYPRAQEHLQQLQQALPQERNRLVLLETETLYQQGLQQQATQVISQALAQSPDDIGLRYARALYFERQQQLAQAEEDLRHILRLQPNHTQTLNTLGYLLADNNLQLNEAHQLLSQALALAPEDPAIIDSMGWVEYRLGNLNNAIALLQRAFNLSEGDAETGAHLGEALWVNGNKEEAIAVWQQAAQQHHRKHGQQAALHPLLRATLERFKVELP